MSQKKINNFIKLLPNCIFILHYVSSQRQVTITRAIGDVEISFVLSYEVHTFDHLPQTYDSPEECSFEFENLDICDVQLFHKDSELELSNEQLGSVCSILFKKLI